MSSRMNNSSKNSIIKLLYEKRHQFIFYAKTRRIRENVTSLTTPRQQVLLSISNLEIITAISISNWSDIKNIHFIIIDEHDVDNIYDFTDITNEQLLSDCESRQDISLLTSYSKEMLELQCKVNKSDNRFLELNTLNNTLIPALISGSYKGLHVFIDSDEDIERDLRITYGRVNNRSLFRRICDTMVSSACKRIESVNYEVNSSDMIINIPSVKPLVTMAISVPKNIPYKPIISTTLSYSNNVTNEVNSLDLCFSQDYELTDSYVYTVGINTSVAQFIKSTGSVNKIILHDDSTITVIHPTGSHIPYKMTIYYMYADEFIYYGQSSNTITSLTPELVMRRYNSSLLSDQESNRTGEREIFVGTLRLLMNQITGNSSMFDSIIEEIADNIERDTSDNFVLRDVSNNNVPSSEIPNNRPNSPIVNHSSESTTVEMEFESDDDEEEQPNTNSAMINIGTVPNSNTNPRMNLESLSVTLDSRFPGFLSGFSSVFMPSPPREDNIDNEPDNIRRFMRLYTRTIKEMVEQEERKHIKRSTEGDVCMVSTDSIEVGEEYYKMECCKQFIEREPLINWLYKAKKDTCPNCRKTVLELPQLYIKTDSNPPIVNFDLDQMKFNEMD